MGALKLLFSTYWQPILALTLCLSIVGYVGYQRHRINALERDNASLQQTIDLAKAVGQAQNEKTARIEEGAHTAVILQAAQGQDDINKIKAYYEAHPIAKSNAANRVCQPATNPNRSELPSVPIASQESPDSGKDANTAASGQSLEYQCAVTTSQYNTLYQSWMNACAASACK